MRAIQEVLPPFDNDPVESTRQILLEDNEVGAQKELTIYLGIKEDEITGLAFPVFGEGYGGLIHVMVGINLQGEVSGVEVLEHLETPGLGAKIEEASFTDQFKGKSLANSLLVNGNLAVKKDGGDLDALTGATISPRGVANAASAGLKIYQRHGQQILGLPQNQNTNGGNDSGS
jgi:electron transport complex protein RnfG